MYSWLEHFLQRLQATGLDGLADMRMIEHDQIVAAAQIGDRVRLETFQRLLVPGDRKRIPGRIERCGRRGQRIVAPRMIPGERAIASDGHGFAAAITPAFSRRSMVAAS